MKWSGTFLTWPRKSVGNRRNACYAQSTLWKELLTLTHPTLVSNCSLLATIVQELLILISNANSDGKKPELKIKHFNTRWITFYEYSFLRYRGYRNTGKGTQIDCKKIMLEIFFFFFFTSQIWISKKIKNLSEFITPGSVFSSI